MISPVKTAGGVRIVVMVESVSGRRPWFVNTGCSGVLLDGIGRLRLCVGMQGRRSASRSAQRVEVHRIGDKAGVVYGVLVRHGAQWY